MWPRGYDPPEFRSCHDASGKKALPGNILEGFVQVVVILDHIEGEVLKGLPRDSLYLEQGDDLIIFAMVNPNRDTNFPGLLRGKFH